MQQVQELAARVLAVRAEIEHAAQRVGRSADEVMLIAVTKTHPARLVVAAMAAGVLDMGENRVQEAEEKIDLLAKEHGRLRWHMIGTLQRNKARKAAALFDLVHTVDNLPLAQALNKYVDEDSLVGQRRLPVLLQINLAGETQKGGIVLTGGLASPDVPALYTLVESIVALPQLEIQGLMTVPPYDPDPNRARPQFTQLHALRDELARRYPQATWQHLSMGMSGDYTVAVEEGATLVRVGTAIFGTRPAV